MIEGVLRLADRPVRVVMTPRTEITWVDIEADGEALLRAVARRRFSRLLVCEDSVDNAVGILHTKDVLPLALKNEPIAVRAAMVPAVIVHVRTPVMHLHGRFRRGGIHMAVMVNDYGPPEAIHTLTDAHDTTPHDHRS